MWPLGKYSIIQDAALLAQRLVAAGASGLPIYCPTSVYNTKSLWKYQSVVNNCAGTPSIGPIQLEILFIVK